MDIIYGKSNKVVEGRSTTLYTYTATGRFKGVVDAHGRKETYIVILMVLLFIIGGILGYFRIGNNLYMEAGGVVLGVSALGHLYAKYCIKNIKFTLIICLCAITYLIFFGIGYHFGSNYSA